VNEQRCSACMNCVCCRKYVNSVCKLIREISFLNVSCSKRYRKARHSHENFGTHACLTHVNCTKRKHLIYESEYLLMRKGNFGRFYVKCNFLETNSSILFRAHTRTPVSDRNLTLVRGMKGSAWTPSAFGSEIVFVARYSLFAWYT
jgi:hypothetical protein